LQGKDAVAQRSWALLPLVLFVAGCLSTGPDQEQSALAMRFRPELAPDTVIIDFFPVERELGDPYLSRELWTHTDEFVVDLEKKTVLEQNGLRIGQIVGMTPGDFQKMITSERWCQKPFRRICTSGQAYTHFFDPVRAHCDYDVYLGGQKHELRADRARFGFEVLPQLTADGKTRLRFTPKVDTGEQVLPFTPSPENSNWQIKIERPCKVYAELAFEVILAPNENVVLGTLLDKESTLGYHAFVDEEGSNPLQRVLVIRTNRSARGGKEAALLDMPGVSPPLALQATMSAVRASRP
jgi:hypothetical protein